MGLMAGADADSDIESAPQAPSWASSPTVQISMSHNGLMPTPWHIEFAARGREANPYGQDAATVSACARASQFMGIFGR